MKKSTKSAAKKEKASKSVLAKKPVKPSTAKKKASKPSGTSKAEASAMVTKPRAKKVIARSSETKPKTFRSRKVTNLTKNVQEGCYMARIMRQGNKYQKNFPAKKWGGWAKARDAAAAWVAEKKGELPTIEESRLGNMSSRNQSGVVGVYLRRTLMKKPSGVEYEYWSWMARWPGCSLNGGIRFGIAKSVTDEDAFTLAVIARQMKEVNRDKVKAEFKRLEGTKEHKAILNRKMLYFG